MFFFFFCKKKTILSVSGFQYFLKMFFSIFETNVGEDEGLLTNYQSCDHIFFGSIFICLKNLNCIKQIFKKLFEVKIV